MPQVRNLHQGHHGHRTAVRLEHGVAPHPRRHPRVVDGLFKLNTNVEVDVGVFMTFIFTLSYVWALQIRMHTHWHWHCKKKTLGSVNAPGHTVLRSGEFSQSKPSRTVSSKLFWKIWKTWMQQETTPKQTKNTDKTRREIGRLPFYF